MHSRVPDLAALEILDAVARTGSMSAAAKECHVTQQAVSTRVRAAERLMGVEVFLRSPRGAALTADGESVIAWTREVLAASDRMGQALDLLHGTAARALTVGGSQTIAAWLLPGWMLQLRARQLAAGGTLTTVRLRAGNSAQIAQQVRGGLLDVGFIESPEVPDDLGSAHVGDDELVVVVPPDHPWAARGWIGLRALAEASLVTRERGSGTRLAYERAVAVQEKVDAAPPLLELSTTVAVLQAVAQGIAPAVLSARAVADDVQLGRVVQIPIAGAPVARPLTALWRGGPRDLGVAARALVAVAAGPGTRIQRT